MSELTPNLGLFKYNPSTDGKEVFSINTALNDNWDILDNLGSGKNIGEIVVSTIPLVDAGLHLLDGSLIQGDGIYSSFVTYIAGLVSTYPDLFLTETDWQQAITDYGVCGNFVYNSTNNTVRLPKYSNKIFTGEGTAPVIGNGMSLGLLYNDDMTVGLGALSNGALYGGRNGAGLDVGTSFTPVSPVGNVAVGVHTDPSKSGLIADLSNITTSLDGYYYIVIATSTKTDIQVDIDEIATDLNGKADVDLSNCTKPHIVETYVNGLSWYRVYSDNWCEQGGTYTGITQTAQKIMYLKHINAKNVLVCTRSGAPSYSYTAYCNVVNYTSYTDGFLLASNGGDGCWYASGYLL